MAKAFITTLVLASMLLGIILCGVEGKLCRKGNEECGEMTIITPQRICNETLFRTKPCDDEKCHKLCVAKYPFHAEGTCTWPPNEACLCFHICN
ncbi:hypothetical protein M5689_020878 [Euphorbia peplus]|nr:hypothetical protein M5689_020878 [Euphorbia peplus]